MRLMKKICIAGLATLFAGFAHSAAAQNSDEWQFEATLYGWYSDVDGTIKYPGGPGSGGDFSIEASDLVSDLEFVLMGGFAAKRDRLSFLVDGIYMDAGASETITVTTPNGTPIRASAGFDLTTWIVSTGVGYDLVQGKRGTLAAFGGIRYLNADVEASLNLQGVPASRSDSSDVFDGIVGLRGAINLGEHWYIPFHGDIGTGQSDLTWQLFSGIGYRFSWGNVRLGYRYLRYEQDDDKLLQELDLSGPVMGVGFRF